MKNTALIELAVAIVVAAIYTGCSAAKTETAGPTDPIEQLLRDRENQPLGDDAEYLLAATAREFIDRRDLTVNGRRYRSDCSGTVSAIFAQAGCPLVIDIADERGGTASIYASLNERNLLIEHDPHPGDLVFFDNTYDRNRNGMLDDELSHIGIVTAVDDSGNIDFVHYGSGRIKEGRLNLSFPDKYRDDAGQLLNDYIRVKESSDPPGTRYLTGQLMRSFGRWPPCADRR